MSSRRANRGAGQRRRRRACRLVLIDGEEPRAGPANRTSAASVGLRRAGAFAPFSAGRGACRHPIPIAAETRQARSVHTCGDACDEADAEAAQRLPPPFSAWQKGGKTAGDWFSAPPQPSSATIRRGPSRRFRRASRACLSFADAQQSVSHGARVDRNLPVLVGARISPI